MSACFISASIHRSMQYWGKKLFDLDGFLVSQRGGHGPIPLWLWVILLYIVCMCFYAVKHLPCWLLCWLFKIFICVRYIKLLYFYLVVFIDRKPMRKMTHFLNNFHWCKIFNCILETKYSTIYHSYDIWHVAKDLRKKLVAVR